ncbi:MAG: DUF58 domain-containing protein [Tannerella sp.]|jgi:uncharacterized protein (DUF58 family)|nr:DUF58 domain-containing protein [Tannerella sp.]
MYLTKRFYIIGILLVLLFVTGYFFPIFFAAGKSALAFFTVACIVDYVLLWHKKRVAAAERYCTPRFSNGDENEVRLVVEHYYPFIVNMEIIDEIPVIFQCRDILFKTKLKPGNSKNITYKLRPVKRGKYGFGNIILYLSTVAGLIQRRVNSGTPVEITVYPSYVMLNKYELMAVHNNLTELGIKKIRRTGHNTEFEYIKEYTKGDDYRTINWKASARRHYPMINIYQDEKSQQVYSVIDKGRIMQNAFHGMTLLDYAINASLVLSYIAIKKEDKAGLATFEADFGTFLPADKQSGQMQKIMECLYHQETAFGESDYSSLYVHINKYINKRSLLVIYTNFDTVVGMERQIEYIRKLSEKHAVLVIFFEDGELKEYAKQQPDSIEAYYNQTVAEKFISDKLLVVGKLRQYGIYPLLTEPENLSVNIINKYLEMKARGII